MLNPGIYLKIIKSMLIKLYIIYNLFGNIIQGLSVPRIIKLIDKEERLPWNTPWIISINKL